MWQTVMQQAVFLPFNTSRGSQRAVKLLGTFLKPLSMLGPADQRERSLAFLAFNQPILREVSGGATVVYSEIKRNVTLINMTGNEVKQTRIQERAEAMEQIYIKCYHMRPFEM